MKKATPNGRNVKTRAQIAISYGGRKFALPPETSLRVAKMARKWHTTAEKAMARILEREVRHLGNSFFCSKGAITR